MAQIQRKYNFVNGSRSDAEQVDEEFDNIIQGVNTLDTEVQNHKTSGDHDGRYYTETEIDTKLAQKTDATGNHSGTWQGLNPADFDGGQQAIDLASHKADYVKHPGYATATNTLNDYSVTLNPAPTAYVDGMGIAVTINANSTGATTLNVNGLGAKSILKSNGTAVSNLKTNGVYTVRYNPNANAGAGAFILQGEGGSGNAVASDLLSGKTATTDAGDITGTMPDKVGSLTTLSPGSTDQAIPQGYYDGTLNSGKVAALTITAGDSILINLAAEMTQNGQSNWVMMRELRTDTTGIYRVKFDLKASYGGINVRGQIRKNGVAYGTERITSSTTYTTYTEDLSFSANDLIQIYLFADNSGYPPVMRNFILACSIDYPTITVNK